jgi:hypothetical protein
MYIYTQTHKHKVTIAYIQIKTTLVHIQNLLNVDGYGRYEAVIDHCSAPSKGAVYTELPGSCSEQCKTAWTKLV